MNALRRWLLDRRLKQALSRHACRLDSGTAGLRGGRLVLEPGVKLHNVKVYAANLHIGAYTDIVSSTELLDVNSIGRYCSIAAGCVVGQNRHSHPLHVLSTSSVLVDKRLAAKREAFELLPAAPARLGHDVWIGRDVMVMAGVSIGTGAIIGAQSLVTRDVPPYAIVAGSPAKVLRYRFEPEVCEQLLASQWWRFTPEQLAQLPLEAPLALALAVAGLPAPAPLPWLAIGLRKGVLQLAPENAAPAYSCSTLMPVTLATPR